MNTQTGKISLIALLIGIVAIGAAVFGIMAFQQNNEPREPAPSENGTGSTPNDEADPGEAEWNTYRNTSMGIAFSYPQEWEVVENLDDVMTPSVSVYKPTEDPQFPLTHHSNATHVSFYPEGIPTEGVFGEVTESELEFEEEVENARDYLLSDGRVWGTMVRFANTPDQWEPSGFVWGAVLLRDLETECVRGEERIPSEECDPLGDPTVRIVRDATISTTDRETVERILSTFTFVQE